MSVQTGARAGRSAWSDPERPVDERVDAVLAVMTLPEKLGQLGSAWLGMSDMIDVAPMQDVFTEGDLPFEALREHGLGHLTRTFGTAPVSVADGTRMVVDRQGEIVGKTRLGIPATVHEECLTGFTTLGATEFPAAIAWAATFDADLVERMAAAIGADMAVVGVHQGLSPVLDVVRDYRWGRVEETLGEDPYLVSTLGTAYVRGLEGAGIIATLKHFAGYSASRAARNHGPVSMGAREFRDVMLPSFEMAIRDGRARSVMNSYADVDGVPAGADVSLLTGVLRDEWGFTGTVVSDYWAIAFLASMHRVADSAGQAGALALRAGIDVELPGTLCYGGPLLELLRDGTVDESLVDRAARRVVRQKIGLGLLDEGWTPRGSISAEPDRDLDSPANRVIARDLAEESIVLLANDGLLPLRGGAADAGADRESRPSPQRIAVVGPCGDDAATFLGCYSFTNHVLPRYPELGLGVPALSLTAALCEEFTGAEISYTPGCPVRESDVSGIGAAVRAAKDADVCVLAVGDRAGLFGRGTSGEGCDAQTLDLPGVQDDLAEQVLGSGTPVVLVVVSGRPYALGRHAGRAAAVVQAFMPGEEGGPALAGVLSGRVGPTGRLPVQIPRLPGGSPHTYLQPPLGTGAEGMTNLDHTPLFPFGHGLSYTSWQYGELSLSADRVATDAEVTASVDITNTGDRAGTEVVQLYLHDVQAQVARPVQALIGYARVQVAAGQTAGICFRVHADRTCFTGLNLTRIVEPGQVELSVGASVGDLRSTASLALTGALRVVGHDRVMTTPVSVTTLT